MFPDPSTTRIVHDTMIAEELARRNPDHRDHERDDSGRPRRTSGLRRNTARMLVRLADRIAPTPLPQPQRTAA